MTGRILVTGATGYVGGRLVPRLVERAESPIRIFVRDASRIVDRGWGGVEIVQGDVLDESDNMRALNGVDVAYYLVHSMNAGAQVFADRDREAAEKFSRAAKKSGVQRIVYLGGLGEKEDILSPHLRSRHETGECLRSTGVPVTEFRAGMIIGSGSLSFEMLRYLAERVPIMICPKWVKTKAQPIAIRDVLRYLVECLDREASAGKIIEIGGADILSYGEMLKVYSEVRNLNRWIVDVPVLTPRLSSYWVNFVTPIPAQIARPLIEGLRNEVVVTNPLADRIFDFEPIHFREALMHALERTFSDRIETRWSSALSALPSGTPSAAKLENLEGLIIEERFQTTKASRSSVFRVIQRLGGDSGWPYAQWLWALRGWIDRLLGGVGLRRGRRSPTELRVGDALDFWRVEAIEPDKLLRLRAEMKLPGRAWLEYTLKDTSDGCVAFQRAIFDPKGLGGLLYWYSIYPLHAFIFQGMIDSIVRKAERDTVQGA